MDAAIECLAERGFAATSTISVQERAGVSRGRMMHHFPSKNALLVAAVHHLAATRMEELRSPEPVLDAPDRVRATITQVWETYEGVVFGVEMELWNGARHDDDLREPLVREEIKLGWAMREKWGQLFGPEITSQPGYADFRELLIESMRGAAMANLLTGPHLDRAGEDVERWYRCAVAMLDLPAV
jgi:AcrR family transcriptional regulator